MNKQALTEALMAFENLKGKGVVLSGRYIIEDAARLVERLLPGECEHGETKEHGAFRPGVPGSSWMCPGQVWDEGIVEVVAGAIVSVKFNERVSAPNPMAQARAVLSAIVQLAEEGSE